MKLLRPVEVFVVVVVVEFEVVVIVWEDGRMQLPMRGWDGPMEEKTL